MTSLKTVARITGVLYLGLAVAGAISFPIIRPAIFDPTHPAITAAHLINMPWMARLGIAMEMSTVLTQALVALSFYWLFRPSHAASAFGIAAFGVANAIVILVSAIAMTTAYAVARDPGLAPGGDVAATIQLLYTLSGAAWICGGLFFGLWLIPMGYCVIVSRWMPRLLGISLIAGGVGYVISGYLAAVPDPSGLFANLLGIPASVGEIWMILYLLIIGVRRGSVASAPVSPA